MKFMGCRGMFPGELEGGEGIRRSWAGQGSLEQMPKGEEGGSCVVTWMSPERLSNLPRSHSE